jgi:hypothetical protein
MSFGSRSGGFRTAGARMGGLPPSVAALTHSAIAQGKLCGAPREGALA